MASPRHEKLISVGSDERERERKLTRCRTETRRQLEERKEELEREKVKERKLKERKYREKT